MSRFMAVWPVVDETVPAFDLLHEAVADLKAVARRHGVTVIRYATPIIRSGRAVPGSGGARTVVTITADVEPIRREVAA